MSRRTVRTQKENTSDTVRIHFGTSLDTVWNLRLELEIELELELVKRICPELEQSPSVATEEPPVEVIISLPILGGKEFPVTKKHYNTFVEAYPWCFRHHG